jgi:predicted DNA-binding transcriptional regulator AlpA
MQKQEQSSQNEKRYINEAEAARLTGMSKHWFQRARWAGDGPPYVKLGHAVRYEVTALMGWFDRRTKSSTSEKSPINLFGGAEKT